MNTRNGVAVKKAGWTVSPQAREDRAVSLRSIWRCIGATCGRRGLPTIGALHGRVMDQARVLSETSRHTRL